MNKANELKYTKNLVKDILEKEPLTRNSDMTLYIKVAERLNPAALNKPFWFVLSNLKEENLPSMETVRRTRQKVQEMHKELRAVDDVEAQRMMNEEAFREFAKGEHRWSTN